MESKIDLLWDHDSILELIEVHHEISSIARDLIRQALTNKWALKPLDAIHLASAKWLGIKEFFTYDSALQKYSDYIECKILEPYVLQPNLPNM